MNTTNVILFLNLGTGEILIVVMCVLMFFGTDKLPEMMRAFGRGMREMKNATSEIQREIENGATEIQRDANLKSHLDELKEATDKIQGRLKEGLTELEEHHNTPEIDVEEDRVAADETNNPLVPPDAIKRN